MSINIKPAHKGLLHKKLGVPQGQTIPMGKIRKAEGSASPALRKEASFAATAKTKFNHGGGGLKPQTSTPVATDRGAFKIKG